MFVALAEDVEEERVDVEVERLVVLRHKRGPAQRQGKVARSLD